MPFVAVLFILLLATPAIGRLAGPWTLPDQIPRQLGKTEAHGKCVPQLFSQMGSPILQRYEDCVHAKLNTTDLTVAGSSVGVYAECWCQINMTSFMRDHGCADHPKWRWLCELECHDDCGSDEVAKCLGDCPALCYERGYNLPGCKSKCAEYDCTKHLLCIVEDSENATHAGLRNRTCDEQAIQHSGSLHEFSTCLAESPYRTKWDQLASRDHCLCKAGLQTSLRNESCCEVNRNGAALSIYDALCGVNCSVDCDNNAAKHCLQECAKVCVDTTRGLVPPDCWHSCMQSDAPCHQYKVCTPAPRSFDYFCNDGSEPEASSGCCKSLRGSDECPTWCERQLVNLLGPVCQCGECPATKERTHELMNWTITRSYENYCLAEVNAIAHAIGLRNPTFGMLELLSLETAAISKAIADHGSYFDAELERQVWNITNTWNLKILDEAWDAVGTIRANEATHQRRSTRRMFIILVTLVSICLLTIFAWKHWLKRSRVGRAHSGQDAQPYDSSVVVGRPLGNEPGGIDLATKTVDGVLLGRVLAGSMQSDACEGTKPKRSVGENLSA